MIVDSQQWDERHAAREADNEYRHAVLKSNLQQRSFENDMAEQTMEIRRNGDQRAADAAERAIFESNRNYKLNQDAAAFDKTKFAETQERNKLLNEETQLKIDELKIPSTPTRVDLNGLISPRLAKNSGFMGELNEWAGERNMIIGDDLIGMSADADGNYSETLASPNEQVKYAPFVRGLAAKYDNPIDNIKEDMVVLEEYRQELKKQTVGTDNYNLKERAEAKRNMKVVEAELASQKQALLDPETAKEAYGRRAQEMQGAADWLRLQGANDAADDYSTGAMKLLDNALAADKTSKGQRIQTWKPELTNNASVPGPSLVFDTVTEMYTGKYTDADGNIQEISVPQVSDLGLVTDEPTPLSAAERGLGGDSEVKGGMTDAQMINFQKDFAADGMAAMFASQEATAMKETMGELTTANYIKGDLVGTNAGRLAAREDAKAFRREQEHEYWEERKSIEEYDKKTTAIMADKSRTILVTLIEQTEANPKAPKSRLGYYNRKLKNLMKAGTSTQALKKVLLTLPKIPMEIAYREKTGNPNMIVYTPNNTTKQMTYGTGSTGAGE
jgi:hypothetical protein